MQELIEHLKELQSIDSELQFIGDLRGNLPHQVDMLDNELKEAKDIYTNKKELLEQTKKEIRLTQLAIEDLKKKKEKYQAQLYEVTNNKEYDAVTSEIDSVDKTISDNEDKVIMLMEQEEQLTAELDKDKEHVDKLQQNLEQKETELEKKNAKTEKEELTLKDKKDKLISRIDQRYLSMYERIRKAKNGLAVVPIQNGSCGGCSKRLPPQKILEIRSKKGMHVCEVCGRIIVSDGSAS